MNPHLWLGIRIAWCVWDVHPPSIWQTSKYMGERSCGRAFAFCGRACIQGLSRRWFTYGMILSLGSLYHSTEASRVTLHGTKKHVIGLCVEFVCIFSGSSSEQARNQNQSVCIISVNMYPFPGPGDMNANRLVNAHFHCCNDQCRCEMYACSCNRHSVRCMCAAATDVLRVFLTNWKKCVHRGCICHTHTRTHTSTHTRTNTHAQHSTRAWRILSQVLLPFTLPHCLWKIFCRLTRRDRARHMWVQEKPYATVHSLNVQISPTVSNIVVQSLCAELCDHLGLTQLPQYRTWFRWARTDRSREEWWPCMLLALPWVGGGCTVRETGLRCVLRTLERMGRCGRLNGVRTCHLRMMLNGGSLCPSPNLSLSLSVVISLFGSLSCRHLNTFTWNLYHISNVLQAVFEAVFVTCVFWCTWVCARMCTQLRRFRVSICCMPWRHRPWLVVMYYATMDISWLWISSWMITDDHGLCYDADGA